MSKKTGSSYITIYAVSESGIRRAISSINISVADQVYRLTFHANGGTFDNGDTETADVWDGNQFWFYRVRPSHSSKAFSKKWYTSSSCDESKLAADESQSSYFTPTEDMDLYAGWDEAYTITYDFDGIEYDGKTQAVYQIKQGDCIGGNRIYFPDDPAKTGGKLFKGWKLKDGTVTKDIYYYTPDSNETLTAVWSDYYTITFDYNGGHPKDNWMEYSKVFYVIPGEKIGNYIYDLEPGMDMTDYTLEGWLAPDGEIYMNDTWHIAQYVPTGDETLKAVWGKSHTVRFDGNGGTYGNQPTRTVKVSDGGILSTNDAVFKRDGYEFAGWKIQETGEVLSIDTEAYIVTQDLTLVAQWIQKDYWTITYDANGGTFKNDSYKSAKVAKDQTAYVLRRAYCTKDGSVLIGWKIKDDPSGTIYSNSFVPESDVTLVAQWAEAVNITLNANGGTFSTGSETTVYAAPAGQTFGHNESLETPVNGDKKFLGWYTDSACTHPLKTSQVISSDITLYAKWTENAYTVTVHAYGPWYKNAEGNMVEEASFTIPQGSKIGSVSLPDRSGYVAEWYLDEAKTMPFNSNYIPDKDVDLYAGYRKQITVHWNADGGVDSRGDGNGRLWIGVGQRAVLPEVTKKDAAFAGWYRKDGNTEVKVENEAVFYEPTVLTAHWNTEGYRVRFDLDGGSLYTSKSEKKYTTGYRVNADETIDLADLPQKENMAFLGWKSSSDGNVYPSAYGRKVTCDTVFTAQWGSGVTVTLHAGSGSFYEFVGNGNIAYKDTVAVNVGTAKGAGSYIIARHTPASYDVSNMENEPAFVGWSLTENGPVIDVADYTFTQNTDLYAQWKASNTVIFVLNGGMNEDYARNSQDTISKTFAAGSSIKLPVADKMKKDGYTFVGWHKSADLSDAAITEEMYTPSGNEVLYAEWTEGNVQKHTVTFITNGGSTMDPVQVTHGKKLAEPEDPEKTGYAFLGWYTDQGCTRKYDFNTLVTKDLILYADWGMTLDLRNAAVTLADDKIYTYTGEPIIPEFTVELNGNRLEKDVDYEIMDEQADNVNAGDNAYITIAAKGDTYTGEKKIEFVIEKAEMHEPAPEVTVTPTYGDRLSTVPLSGNWEWKNPDERVNKPSGETYTAFLTPEKAGKDPKNYKVQEEELSLAPNPRSLEGAIITLASESYTYTGSQIKPVVMRVELDGEIIPEEGYRVTYENNYYVHSYNGGKPTVTVSGRYNYTGSASTTFTITKADPRQYLPTEVLKGKYGQFLSEVSLGYKGWSWSEPNTKLDFNESGENTKAYPVVFSDTDNYETVEDATVEVKVEQRSIDQSPVKMTLLQDEWIDTGKENDGPKFTVTDTVYGENVTLEEDVDYTVKYYNYAERGIAYAYGKGKYRGITSQIYTVKADVYNLASAEIVLDNDTYDYAENTEFTPNVLRVIVENTPLEETAYSVEYGNNRKPGLGYVKVTGIDPYHGSAVKYFEIKPEQYPLGDQVFGTPLKEITLPDGWTWNDPDTIIGNAGTSVSYGAKYINDAGKELNGTFLVNAAAKKITDPSVKIKMNADGLKYDNGNTVLPVFEISDEKTGKTLEKDVDYSVVVYGMATEAGEATVAIRGLGNYTGETEKFNYTIAPADGSVKISDAYLQDGKLSFSVQDIGNSFFLGTEYTGSGEPSWTSGDEQVIGVEKTFNSETGKMDGKLTVVGIGETTLKIEVPGSGNYGAAEVQYQVSVAKTELKAEFISLDLSDCVYNGEQHKPAVTVIAAGMDDPLTENEDYTVEYGENIHAGENAGSVTVTGINNYTGEVKVSFKIEQAENPASVPAEVTVPYGTKLYDIELETSEFGTWEWDVEDQYVGNVGRHTYDILLMSKDSDYKDLNAKQTVVVEAKQLAESMVSLEYNTTNYDETEKKPGVTVQDGTLITENAYTVTYADNKKAGTEAKVIVSGKGNYTGTVEKTFTINRTKPVITIGAGTNISAKLSDKTFALNAAASNHGTLSYQSSDTGIAAVDANGIVTFVKAGTVEITVNYAGTEEGYDAASTKAVIVITEDENNTGDHGSGGNDNGGNTSGGNTSGGNTSGGNTSGGNISGGNTSGGNTSGGSTSGGSSSGGSSSGGSSSGGSSSSGSSSSGSSSSSRDSGVQVKQNADGSYPYAGQKVAYESLPQNFSGASIVYNNIRMPEYVDVAKKWSQTENNGWELRDSDGNAAKNTWIAAYNPYADLTKGQDAFSWYHFDENGKMQTGWLTDKDGNTFYLNPVSDNTLGGMVTGWQKIDGKWYYFNEVSDGTRGKLAKNTKTPDGYVVLEDGSWDGKQKQ